MGAAAQPGLICLRSRACPAARACVSVCPFRGTPPATRAPLARRHYETGLTVSYRFDQPKAKTYFDCLRDCKAKTGA